MPRPSKRIKRETASDGEPNSPNVQEETIEVIAEAETTVKLEEEDPFVEQLEAHGVEEEIAGETTGDATGIKLEEDPPPGEELEETVGENANTEDTAGVNEPADESEPAKDWRDKIPDENSSDFPRKYQDVLRLMNKLIDEEERGGIDYWEENFNHKRHGHRKGRVTRGKLRDLKDKHGQFKWHKKRGEWCPKTKDDLVDLMEQLDDMAVKFVSQG